MTNDPPPPDQSPWGDSHRSWLRGRARALLGRRGRRSMDASDAAQEALLLGGQHRDRATLESRAQERAWLWTILRNLVVTRLRRDDRRLEWSDWGEDRLLASSAGPATRCTRSDQARQARELLNSLPEREREVVRLRIEEDLSFAALASRLDLTEGHARVIFHRSLQSLRRGSHADGRDD